MQLLPASTKPTIAELKAEYVKYYADVPVQKYAAMAIARNEDTIMRWRHEDPDFADAVQMAHAEWIRKRMLATKAEFALERLEKSVFAPTATIELQHQAQLAPENPNNPEGKQLVAETLEILMARTKRITSA